jgi:hypothetical protein
MFKKRKQTRSPKRARGLKTTRQLKNLFNLQMPGIKVGTKLQATTILTVALVLGIITVMVTRAYQNSIISDRKSIMQSRLDTIAKEIEMENEQVGSVEENRDPGIFESLTSEFS